MCRGEGRPKELCVSQNWDAGAQKWDTGVVRSSAVGCCSAVRRSLDSICDRVNVALVEKVTAEAKRAAKIREKSSM